MTELNQKLANNQNKELNCWKLAIKESKCNYRQRQVDCLLYRPEVITSQGQKIAEKKLICFVCLQLAFATHAGKKICEICSFNYKQVICHAEDILCLPLKKNDEAKISF